MRKPGPNHALIHRLIDIAVEVCEDKGQVDTDDLREYPEGREGNAQLIGYALHLAVKQGTLIKLGKSRGRFIYGLNPGEPESVVTGLNFCGIAPFKAPCRLAGKYRDYATG